MLLDIYVMNPTYASVRPTIIFNTKMGIRYRRANVGQLVREKLKMVTIGFGVAKLIFELNGTSMFVVIKHGCDTFPTFFSSVINHKDRGKDILCDNCVHQLP